MACMKHRAWRMDDLRRRDVFAWVHAALSTVSCNIHKCGFLKWIMNFDTGGNHFTPDTEAGCGTFSWVLLAGL